MNRQALLVRLAPQFVVDSNAAIVHPSSLAREAKFLQTAVAKLMTAAQYEEFVKGL